MGRRSLETRPLRVKACDLIDFYCRNCEQVRASVECSPFCMEQCPIGRELRAIGERLGEKEKPKRTSRPIGSRLDDHLPPLPPLKPEEVTPAILQRLKQKGYTSRTISEAAGRKKHWIADRIVAWKKRGIIS